MKITRAELAARYGVSTQAVAKALGGERGGQLPPEPDDGRPARYDRDAADQWWGYRDPPGGHGMTRYRAGCRCTACRAAHADDTRDRRRRALYGDGAPMSAAVREQILTDLRAGRTVMQAADRAGTTYQRVYAAAQALPEFGEQLRALS